MRRFLCLMLRSLVTTAAGAPTQRVTVPSKSMDGGVAHVATGPPAVANSFGRLW